MERGILELLTGLKEKSDKLGSYNEDQTKLGIVLPILSRLGWNTEDVDEVHPEFSVERRRVDYALVLEGRPAVFIEAKRPSEDLDNESYEEQLLVYSFSQTVDLAVLTNGLTWSFYLPREGDDWRSRKFYTIDFAQQDETDVSSKLTELLSKANTYSGKALESAKRILKGKVREDAIRDTWPKAWNKIVSEPDSLLAELLAETTERLCGFKPDEAEAAEFIRQHQNNLLLMSQLDPEVEQPSKGGNNDNPRPGGRKGFEQVKDYLIPVIQRMRNGESHTEAFQSVAEKLDVAKQTVQAQCTTRLTLSTQKFVDHVQSGKIIQLIKNRYPQQTELIKRALEPSYS